MIWILRAWNLLCLQDYGNINFLSTQAQLKWVYNVRCIAVCAAVLQLGVLELCSCAVITVRLSACSCSLHTVCTAAALSRGRMKNCRTASRRLQAPVVVFIALVASVAWVWQFRHRCCTIQHSYKGLLLVERAYTHKNRFWQTVTVFRFEINPKQGLEVNTLKACIRIQVGHCKCPKMFKRLLNPNKLIALVLKASMRF